MRILRWVLLGLLAVAILGLAIGHRIDLTRSAIVTVATVLILVAGRYALIEGLREQSKTFNHQFEASVTARLRNALYSLQQNSGGGNPLMQVDVEELLTREPVTVPSTTSIQQAAAIMTENRVSALLIEDDGDLQGLITDRDLRSRCLAKGLPVEHPVSEIMTRDLHCIGKDTPGFEALVTMTRLNVHHLPVVDDGRVVGVLTLDKNTPNAFTDAGGRHRGFLEQADGGTLFLDEIGQMALDLQAKLLTVIEDRRLRRVGAEKPVAVDVQVVGRPEHHRQYDGQQQEHAGNGFGRIQLEAAIPVRLAGLGIGSTAAAVTLQVLFRPGSGRTVDFRFQLGEQMIFQPLVIDETPNLSSLFQGEFRVEMHGVPGFQWRTAAPLNGNQCQGAQKKGQCAPAGKPTATVNFNRRHGSPFRV